ncbi:MAG: hypothetical protein ACD_73C00192G0001, partial [uncultured bacterium]
AELKNNRDNLAKKWRIITAIEQKDFDQALV